jgi:hypothetical protein
MLMLHMNAVVACRVYVHNCHWLHANSTLNGIYQLVYGCMPDCGSRSLPTTGQQLTLKVLSVDPGRCRVALSLKQMSADPTRETMDQLVWADTTTPLPEVAPILEVLGVMGGIQEVSVTRAAEVKQVTQVSIVEGGAISSWFRSP